jgi:hypothetical protein
VFGKRREPEDEPEDDAPAEADAGPFQHQEPPGKSLVVRAHGYDAARKVYDAIFGPGTDLAAEAEKQRRRWKQEQAMKEVGWWLPRTTPLICRTIVVMAICDVGMLEDPPGSNRGTDIDALNDMAKVPVGSYWCAAWVGKIWRNAGAQVPAGYASCDHWMAWAKQTGPLDDPHRGARLCRAVRGAGGRQAYRHRDPHRPAGALAGRQYHGRGLDVRAERDGGGAQGRERA